MPCETVWAAAGQVAGRAAPHSLLTNDGFAAQAVMELFLAVSAKALWFLGLRGWGFVLGLWRGPPRTLGTLWLLCVDWGKSAGGEEMGKGRAASPVPSGGLGPSILMDGGPAKVCSSESLGPGEREILAFPQ